MMTDDDTAWLEAHNATIMLTPMLGVWVATIGWKVLHRYSDERGEYSSCWEVSRRDPDAERAVALCFAQARKEAT